MKGGLIWQKERSRFRKIYRLFQGGFVRYSDTFNKHACSYNGRYSYIYRITVLHTFITLAIGALA
jgi:hypothetical protein